MSLQTYHLEPPCGLMNDPNGLSFYHGRYRVFFQWNRFAKDHTHKEWGEFSSADLAHWSFDGSAIVPDQPYDHSGVHSGCAIEMDGELLLYYTGSDKSCGVRRSHQCLVSTTDCHTYLKEGVIIETPEGFTDMYATLRSSQPQKVSIACCWAPSAPTARRHSLPSTQVMGVHGALRARSQQAKQWRCASAPISFRFPRGGCSSGAPRDVTMNVTSGLRAMHAIAR